MTTTNVVPGETRDALVHARVDADAALAAAGIEIRLLDGMDDLQEVRRLYERIWRTGASNPPVTADLLRAMVKAGSYVGGAYLDCELVGACFGFFSAPERDGFHLHSHIAGVDPRVQGRGVGLALKLHQRAWALARGAHAIAWTYDPLIRRNAWFNLTRLGGEAVEYLPDFYGRLDDDLNGADPTDRLLVRWSLTAPWVASAGAQEGADNRPTNGTIALETSAGGGPLLWPVRGDTVLVGTPEDIEELRLEDPASASAWRDAVREVLGGLLAEGARVRGFDRAGFYVVDRTGR